MQPTISQNRGFHSEALVEEALEKWKQNPRPDRDVDVITDYVHAEPNSWLDKKGIDFVAESVDSFRTPIQVKSTNRAKRKFENFCRRKGLLILAIAVEARDTVGRVMWKIMKGIARFRRKCAELKRAPFIPIPKKSPRLRRRRFCQRYNPICMCH